MSKIGWIIYNGSLKSGKFLDLATMLQQAASRKDSDTRIVKNNELLSILHSNGGTVIGETNQLPDYVLFMDKDLYLARQLEFLEIPVFNSSDVIETCDDKIKTYQLLANKGLPIPRTIIAPKVYQQQDKPLSLSLSSIIEELKLPLIIKEAFGSFGQQVYLIHTFEQLQEKVSELHGKPFIFQEYISTSHGIDARLQVVGNQVVAAIKRSSNTDFRANVTAGAKMEPYVPTKEEEKAAIQAAQVLGADFAGVDILFGPNEQPLICEVNSNAHIRNLLDCTGINAADYMLEHVLQQISNEE